MAVFEFRNAQDVGRVLKHHGVKYLFLYAEQEEIRRGKDFIQLRNGPFDLDLIFAPDGIERFDDAWKRRVEKHGFHASSNRSMPSGAKIKSKSNGPLRNWMK